MEDITSNSSSGKDGGSGEDSEQESELTSSPSGMRECLFLFGSASSPAMETGRSKGPVGDPERRK